MKKHYFALLCILVGIHSFAQQKPLLLSGNISLDSLKIEHVHIINKTQQIGTTSNTTGNFDIPVEIGDTIELSHLEYEFSEIIITSKNINAILKIKGIQKTHQLEEFELNNQSVFYVDKEIMPHNLPIVNAATLNLPYANSTKKKKTTLVAFNSGFSVDLENLISRINGTYKRTKKAKQLYADDLKLANIRSLFTDDFFVTDLNIKKEYINQFLNFCKNSPILKVYTEKNYLELVRILKIESAIFPHQIENEAIFLTQN